MSECQHKFTFINRGYWFCVNCGIAEIEHRFRTRAEAAEKERDEWIAAFRKQVAEDGHTIETLDQDNQRLMQENAQLKDENFDIRSRVKSAVDKFDSANIIWSIQRIHDAIWNAVKND